MNNSKVSDKLFEHTELKPYDLIKTIEGDVFEVATADREKIAYSAVVVDVIPKKDKEGRKVLAVPYDEIVSVKRDGEYLNLSHFDNIPASYDYVLHLKGDQSFAESNMEKINNSIKEHKRIIEILEGDLRKEKHLHKTNKQFIKRLTEINVDK